MDDLKISLPLHVFVKNKKFALNLNIYRNAHYRLSNDAKINYKEIVVNLLRGNTKKFNKIEVTYTLYPKTKRRTDLGNILSIVQKFFEDAIVSIGIIEDDDYLHIVRNIQEFGCVDKNNPRVDVFIKEFNE